MTKDDISASMKHVVLVGACYLDTILDVPYYPQEDEKLRATAVQVRRGGNCPNSLEVLKQLLAHDDDDPVALHLVTTLPAVDAAATQTIRASFGPDGPSSSPVVDLDHCLYRAGHAAPASCYIFRSAATGARTIVNANPLPEMTAAEFADMAAAIGPAAWWHFEGRMPETTQACVQHLRRVQPSALVSIEIEKPGRPGLQALAGEADVVLFSKTWAEPPPLLHLGRPGCLRAGPARDAPAREPNPTAAGTLAACRRRRRGRHVHGRPPLQAGLPAQPALDDDDMDRGCLARRRQRAAGARFRHGPGHPKGADGGLPRPRRTALRQLDRLAAFLFLFLSIYFIFLFPFSFSFSFFFFSPVTLQVLRGQMMREGGSGRSATGREPGRQGGSMHQAAGTRRQATDDRRPTTTAMTIFAHRVTATIQRAACICSSYERGRHFFSLPRV